MTKVGFNNLPVDAEGVTFESYLPETEMEAKNLRVCRAFAERFSQRKQEQQEKGNGRNATGLLLFGKYGTGKTLLAYAIMNELERQKLNARYTTTIDLLDDETSSYVYQRYDCLVLDDLGAFELNDREWRRLRKIIIGRIQLGLPTVYITNLDNEELEFLLGGHLFNRFKHSAFPLIFDGRDRRDPIRQTAEEVF